MAEIKQNERLKDLPVVMISTSYAPETVGKFFRTGATVFIHKPDDFTQLKEVIYHALPMAAEKEFSNSNIKYILNA